MPISRCLPGRADSREHAGGLDVELVIDGFAGGRELAGVDVFEQVCPGVLGRGLATELVEQAQHAHEFQVGMPGVGAAQLDGLVGPLAV